ncbi:cytochrome P450 [Calycina marina]|uniref:Cytochrome P450 n=1 Tax=Calycina marina TaxID=1763456 RepID=A0A9P8CCY7_9HELO|nr:cytochrome P450 [Calycina marina]
MLILGQLHSVSQRPCFTFSLTQKEIEQFEARARHGNKTSQRHHHEYDSVVELPCLRSVIKEDSRLSYGIVASMLGVAPKEEMHFQQWTIPRGTAVSMTAALIHHDPIIFPDSHTFDFERLLEGSDSGRLDRYLVPIFTGSKMCLGVNLAWTELYLAMSRMVENFARDDCRMVLWETCVDDV